MNDSPAIFCAAFIAVLIPAALVGGVSQSASVLFIAGCIAAMHVVFLGLPAFLMLRRFKLLRWWSVVLAGILCGIIPMAVTSWPHWAFEGASYTAWDGSRMVEYVVNGVPTVGRLLRLLAWALCCRKQPCAVTFFCCSVLAPPF